MTSTAAKPAEPHTSPHAPPLKSIKKNAIHTLLTINYDKIQHQIGTWQTSNGRYIHFCFWSVQNFEDHTLLTTLSLGVFAKVLERQVDAEPSYAESHHHLQRGDLKDHGKTTGKNLNATMHKGQACWGTVHNSLDTQ